MGNRVIAYKYEILDTLFENELQSIYSAKITGEDAPQQFIINEYKNTDIIYSMKDSFSKEKCRYIRNIVETVYENFCFYVVCNICSGPTMDAYLSSNNLRLTEKMYLTDSLFSQLIDIENLSPFIVYSLCASDNLAVTGKRNICFNCNLKITEDIMAASKSDVSRRVGEIICDIFSNTAAADLNSAKNNMPPALFPIVSSCIEGKYESIAKAYSDFKTLLIYSVFMGVESVDTQMRKNYQKAKIKRRLTPIRRVAAILLILLLAGGVWKLTDSYDVFTPNNTQITNTKPAAEFTASKIRVYEGEKIIFTNKSSDPDSNDSIKSHSWVIFKYDKPIFKSRKENISYTFIEAGRYTIQLAVTDTHGEESDSVQIDIDVLKRLDLPSIDPESEEDINK